MKGQGIVVGMVECSVFYAAILAKTRETANRLRDILNPGNVTDLFAFVPVYTLSCKAVYKETTP